jgi:hypothetical protein
MKTFKTKKRKVSMREKKSPTGRMTQFLLLLSAVITLAESYADYSGRIVEAGDHFKNGASLKSLTSKGNLVSSKEWM